jgi:hypothetical protein
MADEATRATEYRRMMTARVANKEAREKELSGDKSAAKRVLDAWTPLKHWNGWDPPPTPDDEK